MDTSLENYGEYPQIGGHMLEELDMCWVDDVGFDVVKAGLELANVNNTAPGEMVLEDLINMKTDATDTAQFDNWVSQDDYLSLFGNLPIVSDDDITTLLQSRQGDNDLPRSPDSGFSSGSPGSPDVCALTAVAEATSPQNEIPPNSPDSGLGSPGASSQTGGPVTITIEGLGDALCEVTENASPLQTITLPIVSDADLSFIEGLWQNEPAAPEGTQEVVVALDSAPAAPTKSPSPMSQRSTPKKIKSAPARPTKCLSAAEKRERKRAQNKDAATRYREKKRAESQTIYTEQTQLEDKNKNLQDKFNQISREIQYLKELLIEVYRTKGLIE